MPVWTQVEDNRVTSIPPDGQTSVDVFALFSFSNANIPEGATVNFIIGKGGLPEESTDREPRWTLDDILGAITPIEGIQLVSDENEKGYQVQGPAKNRIVRQSDGTLGVLPVAKCSISPIADTLENGITIIAYSDYDKSGQVTRLQPAEVKLTVMSGEGVFLSVAEKYDYIQDQWTEVQSMSHGRSGLFLEEVSGKLYAIGGFNGNFTSTVEEYNPSTDTWSDKTPIPIARGYGSSVVYGGKVYVIGGYSFSPGRASDLVHRYDPVLDQWEDLSSLPMPVAAGTAQVVGSYIYLMGGATQFQEKDGKDEKPEKFNFSVFKYDISGNLWETEDVDTSLVATPASSTLSEAKTAGDLDLAIASGAAFPSYGSATINRGGGNQETVVFTSYDSSTGILTLSATLASSHSSGESVIVSSLTENRMAPSSTVDSGDIKIFNGMTYNGFSFGATTDINTTIAFYEISSKKYSILSGSPTIPRLRSAGSVITSRAYVVGGSADKSDFLNELEYLDLSSDAFVDNLAEMRYSRHSLGMASYGGFLYAVGGNGSGHPPGWLKMEVEANPENVRADGKQTSGITISATDDSGDPPADGTIFDIRGVVHVALTAEEQETASASQPADPESGTVSEPQQTISILPVSFSSRTTSMTGGYAATTMLARSEDPIREVENLFGFVMAGETASPESLSATPSEFRHATSLVGTQRTLYSIAIEVSVIDDFYFGRTDTQAAIAGVHSRTLESSSGGYNFNPETAQQGLSATVSYYSDITSIPDTYVVTDDPVGADDAKDVLEEIGDEIPFGASPHFDAIVTSARSRITDPTQAPLTPPSNIMISTSDNDENYSSYSPEEVVEEVNDVAGSSDYPVFITNFIITDPISMAARAARTDVADLELISSETGGNSFSVVDSSYIDFVITRIKTSAPDSLGSGSVASAKSIGGTVSSLYYEVEGIPGNPGAVTGADTNSATMKVWFSDDNYSFEELGIEIPPNSTYMLVAPRRTSYLKYKVTLRSKTFSSPILKSVSINYVDDNVQFLFTLPQTVSGQVSETSIVANHRLPTGGVVEAGIFHGSSIMFDRDYANTSQPAISGRGTILSVNRSFDTFVGDNNDQSTRDLLYTDDFLVYRSKSGPWSQEAITRVFVNEQEVLTDEYLLFPEDGLLVFRKKLSEDDSVAIEVQLPANMRVGLKITNPATTTGTFDDFAFMYGVTDDDAGIRPNRAPRATNVFISTPVVPGGPMVANYTFTDPDGDEEDDSETEVNWFKNGALVPEIRNLKTVTNSDLIAKRADLTGGLITKGQEWFFTVRPSDGRSFGPIMVSPPIMVSNVAPSLDNLRIESAGDDPVVFLSSKGLVAKFDFVDQDENDESQGTFYTWFVNGVEIKSGTSNGLSPLEEGADGQTLMRPGNIVRVDVAPSDGSDFGITESSEAITIIGTPPTATDVQILPEAPSASSKIKLVFTMVDIDEGEDESDVAWFKNGQRVSELDNARDVNPLLTSPGEQWQATVTPKNGFSTGDAVQSNIVLIQF